jgi:hypothetical protein
MFQKVLQYILEEGKYGRWRWQMGSITATLQASAMDQRGRT